MTDTEEARLKRFLGKLAIRPSQGRDPFIIAMVGLVGSGKSTVAEALSNHLGAVVIRGDTIRASFGYPDTNGRDQTRLIAETCATAVFLGGGIAIIDSDFIDPLKRASLLAKANSVGAKVVFIRTTCEHVVAVNRMIEAKNATGTFFALRGGNPVRIREWARRLPHHYTWKLSRGGEFTLRKLPFRIHRTFDTTDGITWRNKVVNF